MQRMEQRQFSILVLYDYWYYKDVFDLIWLILINKKSSIISETVHANPHQGFFSGEDSPTNGLYVFSVRTSCSSLKVTTASQTWEMFHLYYNSHISVSI